MDDALGQRYAECQQRLLDITEPWLPDGTPRVDFHVHFGIDSGTGEEMTLDAIDHQVDRSGVTTALLIPLNSSDGYGAANARLGEVAASSDGRYRFLARVDPARVADARLDDAFDAGAAGIKLHPQSDGARPSDPRLRPVLEEAAERSSIVLVHAGMDVDGVSEEIMDMARLLPDARFVIGHVAADRLGGVAERMSDLDNVSVCTAWWGASDLAWALAWSDPARFVLGSDPPYGSVQLGLCLTTRVARCMGYDDQQVAGVLGGNAMRLFDGEPVPKKRRAEGAEPAPANGLLARLPAPWQRAYVSLEVAAALAEAGTDPSSQLKLADAALEPELIDPALQRDAEFINSAIELAQDLHAAGDSRSAYITTVAALCIAGTAPIMPTSA